MYSRGRTVDERAIMARDRIAAIVRQCGGSINIDCNGVLDTIVGDLAMAFQSSFEDGVELGATRAGALAKLTDEEKKALGLKT